MKAGTGNDSLGWLFMAGNFTMPILSFPAYESMHSNFFFSLIAATKFLCGWGGVDFLRRTGAGFGIKQAMVLVALGGVVW